MKYIVLLLIPLVAGCINKGKDLYFDPEKVEQIKITSRTDTAFVVILKNKTQIISFIETHINEAAATPAKFLKNFDIELRGKDTAFLLFTNGSFIKY